MVKQSLRLSSKITLFLESLPHFFFYECYDNLLVNQEKLKNELE